MADATDPMDG